ncbi:hypothetical protein GJ496_004101 [Pomphorhynchus laevis]|nr:hypothetical protein GJ496_004101 [Pomphorhynchus laevis]
MSNNENNIVDLVSFDKDQSECILCDNKITIYAFGTCSHHICFVCASKMRVICIQNYCPVCRCNLDKVYFSRSLLNKDNIPTDVVSNKHGICFLEEDIEESFNQLFVCECNICHEQSATFDDLCSHMTKEHRRLYCTICVNFLNLFPNERKFYTREEFADHAISGDFDDPSFTGHPLCAFCKMRFFDKDDLYRHSIADHFYCSFCSVNGKITFYKEYEELRSHFRANHFLCEHGACRNLELSSHVFQSEIELKTHVLEMHTGASRQAKRQAGMLPSHVIFDYSYSQLNKSNNNLDTRRGQANNDDNKADTNADICELNDENFPSLNTANSETMESSETGDITKHENIDFRENIYNRLPKHIVPIGLGLNRQQTDSICTANSNIDSNCANLKSSVSPSLNSDVLVDKITYRVAANAQKTFELSKSEFPSLPQTTSKLSFNSKRLATDTGTSTWRPKSTLIKKNQSLDLNVNKVDPVINQVIKNSNMLSPKIVPADNNAKSISLTPSDFPRLPSNQIPTENNSRPKKSSTNECWSLKAIGKSLTSSMDDCRKSTTADTSVLNRACCNNNLVETSNTSVVTKSTTPIFISPSSSNRTELFLASDSADVANKQNTTAISEQSIDTKDLNQFPSLSSNQVSISHVETNWRIRENNPSSLTTTAIGVKADNTRAQGNFKSKHFHSDTGKSAISTEFRNFDFIPPPNFESRKVILTCKIRDCVGDNEILFRSFKQNFNQYCDDILNVVKFYNSLCDIVDTKSIFKFIYELIALLPNIQKQEELYNTVRSLLQPLSKHEKKNQHSRLSNWGIEPLLKCSLCGQMINGHGDLAYHYEHHEILS